MNNNEQENKIKIFLDKIKDSKKVRLFVIFIIFLLLFVFVFSLLLKSKDTKDTNITELDYVTFLENKLSDILSKIDGAGDVSVMITVESGMETVLAMKTNITESDGKIIKEETPIIVNGKTVVLKENYPSIIGVLIIAEGANDIMVLRKIQQAAISVLDVDLKQIEILSMK